MGPQVRKYLITGKVQGVGYRYFATRVARDLNLKGWVKNLDDGRVEALASGPASRLDRFESELRIGPPRAEVRALQVEEAVLDARIEGFHIR